MLWVVGILAAITAVLLALAAAPAAGAAGSPVSIEPTKFDPAVVVVGVGSEVEWVNRDSRPRALRGDIESPSIAPGGRFELRFGAPASSSTATGRILCSPAR